ncbi:hypothetical protein H072_931 [Dactylellina haptotyla CBS 200.50]|uniref:F-box domain-containing protein n=1 Tax=Dactylellina haptotyla (strain CBS 200.50) TaxID=1284197 RepID=S8AQA5_DACHA|nr:hypothetical protein H072_931 [Dactylellina haptotyla CBS 200.50]
MDFPTPRTNRLAPILSVLRPGYKRAPTQKETKERLTPIAIANTPLDPNPVGASTAHKSKTSVVARAFVSRRIISTLRRMKEAAMPPKGYRISILELPNELLIKIINNLRGDTDTLKNVRLVGRLFNDLASPVLFDRLRIYIRRRYRDREPEWLRSRRQFDRISHPPAPGPDFLFDNVQDLDIFEFGNFCGVNIYNNNEEPKTLEHTADSIRLLQDFVCSFKRLAKLRWLTEYSEPDINLDLSPIAAGVTYLDLHFHYFHHPLVGFKSFQNLTHLKLILRNPNENEYLVDLPHLTNLNIECWGDTDFTSWDWLDAQNSPFNLTVLEVKEDKPPETFPKHLVPKFLSKLQTLRLFTSHPPHVSKNTYTIWDALSENKVQLREVQQEAILSNHMLEYLKSYSNRLENLSIMAPSHTCGSLPTRHGCLSGHEEVLQIMNSLWEDVVSQHASTLKELRIFPGHEHQYRDMPSQATTEQRSTADILNREEPWILGDHIPSGRLALLKCEKLEYLLLGSAAEYGLEEFIDVVVRMKNLPAVKYCLEGRREMVNMGGWCGTAMYRNHQDRQKQQHRMEDIHWSGEGVEDSRFRQLKIEIPPLGDCEFVRQGHWRLRFSEQDEW